MSEERKEGHAEGDNCYIDFPGAHDISDRMVSAMVT